jgi:hypothetical protein
MLGTKVDITFIVIILTRFTSNPNKIHFTTIKRVYKYLKSIINYRITYYKSSNNHYISGYCNTDYAGDIINTKSTTSYIILLSSNIISYKSKL